jgi:hypothetical protein
MLQKIRNVRVTQKLSKLQQIKSRGSHIYGAREDVDEDEDLINQFGRIRRSKTNNYSSLGMTYDL